MGVFPLPSTSHLAKRRLPHARGGVSSLTYSGSLFLRSSPRTWGCFSSAHRCCCMALVFPTHVGVFLGRRPDDRVPLRLPHARGGVSAWNHRLNFLQASSPRTWGCFLLVAIGVLSAAVFPTHVGVFPAWNAQAEDGDSLPHARGGVSDGGRLHPRLSMSSPRTWGCFFQMSTMAFLPRVFPTHVGVFPARSIRVKRPRCLPHARGGVSRQEATA